MSPRPTTLAALAAALVGTGAVGAFVWDEQRGGVIGNGVRVGSVDVSGLTRAEAHERLRERLLAPLDAPLTIRAAGRSFPLTAREAHITANIDAMISDAVARGRTGGILGRTWRAVSGSGVGATVTPEVAFSRPAVQRIVDRVRVTVSRAAQDAKVDFAPGRLAIQPSRSGVSVNVLKLRDRVQRALVSPSSSRTVNAPVTIIRPKVTGEQLVSRYPVVLTVDRGNFRLSLFKDLKPARIYRIAVGQAGLETPAGLYTIQNKAKNPAWHVPNSDWAGDLAGKVIPGGAPDNPIKARWLGVYDGVGVHGTDARGSIGSNASHGCIRMLIEDVEKLYDQVPVGTPIFIH